MGHRPRVDECPQEIPPPEHRQVPDQPYPEQELRGQLRRHRDLVRPGRHQVLREVRLQHRPHPQQQVQVHRYNTD